MGSIMISVSPSMEYHKLYSIQLRCMAFQTFAATSLIVTFHCLPPGPSSCSAYGIPLSPPSLTPVTSGSSPSTSTPSRLAVERNASGDPNSWCDVVQEGQIKCDWLRSRPVICLIGWITLTARVEERTNRNGHFLKHPDPFSDI